MSRRDLVAADPVCPLQVRPREDDCCKPTPASLLPLRLTMYHGSDRDRLGTGLRAFGARRHAAAAELAALGSTALA